MKELTFEEKIKAIDDVIAKLHYYYPFPYICSILRDFGIGRGHILSLQESFPELCEALKVQYTKTHVGNTGYKGVAFKPGASAIIRIGFLEDFKDKLIKDHNNE